VSSDRPAASGSTAEGGPLIFISDASAEADQLASALRLAGYTVVDVPLALLPGRAVVQRPALVVCDVDVEGAAERIRAIRRQPEGSTIPFVLVGEREGPLQALPDDIAASARAVGVRPLDVDDLVRQVLPLVGPGSAAPAMSPGPASLRPALLGPSTHPPVSRRPPTHPAPGAEMEFDELNAAEPIPSAPDISVSSSRPPVSHLELSTEITNLLVEAERRVGSELRGLPAGDASEDEGGEDAHHEAPPGEEGPPLPGDVLEALEEALDDDEGPISFAPAPSDAGAGTQAGTTGIGGSPHARHEGTNVTEHGLASTGAGNAPGDGGTGIDSSQADTSAERRARQEAATPRPPRPDSEDRSSSWPPPHSNRPSTRPPSRPPTDVPDRAPTGPPPATVPSDVPESFAARSLATAAIPFPRPPPDPEIRQPPTEPPQDSRDDPSTAPPPRPREESRPARGTADASTRPPHRGAARGVAPDAVSAPAEKRPGTPALPATLREGDAARALAACIVARWSGGIAFEIDQGIRRVVFRDGDFVTAASGVHGESLAAFLVQRGDLAPDILREAHKMPIQGRHAGAALVARGHLTQDQLWDVLRAHAEWLIGQILGIRAGSTALESELPGRLRDEPSVFGGATGAEVFVEVMRRVLPPDAAATLLGGWDIVLGPGSTSHLLGECALSPEENEIAARPAGQNLAALTQAAGDPSFPSVAAALVELGVLARGAAEPRDPGASDLERAIAEVDAGALRERIIARRALVQEADYFSLLGVPRTATAYDIKRAYASLRRDLDPGRALTPATADLEDDLMDILQVLEEAYDILQDNVRRERYRRAIEATP
jgi:hypothetical protein